MRENVKNSKLLLRVLPLEEDNGAGRVVPTSSPQGDSDRDQGGMGHDDMASTILDTIRTDYESYPRSSQAVARVVLDQPARVLSMSIVELAQLAQVSDPTVLRFARKLGFSGYKEFKQALAAEMSTPAAHVPVPPAQVLSADGGYLRGIVQAYLTDFTAIINDVNDEAFTAAVEVLAQADKVEFWGQCTSSTLAMDAYDKFFRAGVACIVSTEPDQQKLYGRELGEGDVVVAISHLGHNEDLARSLAQARALGATVIGICTEDTVVARACSIAITTKPQVESVVSDMNMKAAHVFLVDVLAIATGIAKGVYDGEL